MVLELSIWLFLRMWMALHNFRIFFMDIIYTYDTYFGGEVVHNWSLINSSCF